MMPVWEDPKSRPLVFLPELGMAVPRAFVDRFQPLVRAQVRVDECPLPALDVEHQLRQRFLEDGRGPESARDVASATADQVREFLDALPIPHREAVVLLWPYEGYCISMPYSWAVRFYDDLWYPSSDDLWLTDQRRTWLVIIDHEERIAFYRRPRVDGVPRHP